MIPVRVGIGLIERGGCYLIRKRPPLPGSPMPGVWEFPGGKCEDGESAEQATIRECKEETGLVVRVICLRDSREHQYSHGHVELNYFDCEPADPAQEPSGGFLWVAGSELIELEFPEANGPILRELSGLVENRPISPRTAALEPGGATQ